MLYEPHEDSDQLASEVKKFAFGKVLDVGTGSGIQALTAAKCKKVDSVIGVDIDPETLEHLSKIKVKKVKFVKSDLFSNVKGKFDTITFNPPYLPQDPGIEDIALYGGKKGYEVVLRFIDDVNNYLEDDGVLLLLFSSLTHKKIVLEYLDRYLFEYELLSTTKQFFEELYVYKIVKSGLLKKINKSGVRKISYHAKGKRGLIFVGEYKKKKVVVKVTNPKSTALGRVDIEGDFLARVNKNEIGPKLYLKGDGFLIMEFIEGISYKEYLETQSKAKSKKIAAKIEKQLGILNAMKIEKQEMGRPFTNVIISDNEPVLIDFERCRIKDDPKNVRQFDEFKKRYFK